MNQVYVIGGEQRNLRSLLSGSQDWYEYQKAVVMRVNLLNGAVERVLEYVSPPEACAAQNPVILFKSGTLEHNRMYLCTQTEILIYSVPDFRQLDYLSLPCFNDLHHVRPSPEQTLIVANTGLDMVLELTPEGSIVREWNVLGTDPWKRFSRQIDYRKGISTKPHHSHPNYLFYNDEQLWVTRFEQKDAICLTHPDQRIEIGIERPHDGVLYDGHLYFTTVNGHVVIVNTVTLQTEALIDLNTMHEPTMLLGWCRSLLVDDDRLLVGFSRLRPTRFRENVSWVKSNFKRAMPTHIACYDLASNSCAFMVDLESHGLNAVFGIFPA